MHEGRSDADGPSPCMAARIPSLITTTAALPEIALTRPFCYREGGRCLTKSATNSADPRRPYHGKDGQNFHVEEGRTVARRLEQIHDGPAVR